jgi:hypothetical protein
MRPWAIPFRILPGRMNDIVSPASSQLLHITLGGQDSHDVFPRAEIFKTGGKPCMCLPVMVYS